MRAPWGLGVVLCLVASPGCGSVSSSDDDASGSENPDDDGDGADGSDGSGEDAGNPPDAAPADAGIVAATCAEPAVCGNAGEVGSVADVVAIASECAEWGFFDIDRYRRRTPTFQVTGPFSVCPADFPPPGDCKEKPLCESTMNITVDPRLLGVQPTKSCFGAQFEAGSRFRVVFHMDPPSLSTQFRTPHIHFERPCGETCEDDERLCEENDACYPQDDVCFACGFGLREECACRTPENTILPNCTECQYIYGDAAYFGQCVDGLCETDPCDTCTCE